MSSCHVVRKLTHWKTASFSIIRKLNTSRSRHSDKDDSKDIDYQKRFAETRHSPSATPFKRTWDILKNDVKGLVGGRSPTEHEIFPTYCDVVIIGGGIMGSSIAYWLKNKMGNNMKVVVVEQDNTYTRSSTVLSLGGLRQQFSLPENIQMSLYGAEFLRNIKKHLTVIDSDPPDVQFSPHGYLFLASEKGAEKLQQNFQLQRDLGAMVELLSPTQLKETFPWIHTDGIALACHGLTNEGWFDPYALLMHFKRKSVSMGAFYVDAEVVGSTFHIVDNVRIREDGKDIAYETIDSIIVKQSNGELKQIRSSFYVLAAGHNSGNVAKMMKIGTGPSYLKHALPVEPRKRYVYVFHCPDGPGLGCPLVIDPSGVYFRREGLGGNFISGRSPISSEEPDVAHLDVDYSYFEQNIWPVIAERVPAFNNLKLKSAWAGFYDYNTYDQNAIIGLHPHHMNVIIAAGFSGHGIQQAPAVGRAVMEILTEGDYKTIDLSRFGFDRIIAQEPMYEQNIV